MTTEKMEGSKTMEERDSSGRLPLTSSTHLNGLLSIRQVLYDAFLPIGYPDSVTPDYLGYQTFDSLQAFFSTITSLLANRAILQGLGVGDASSSATYALLLTILKDGISRVATIAFAYRFGLVIEPECKKYRFLADIFNDSAFFLDLFSPLFSNGTKVFMLVVAEALRAMCGVAAGASKAALSKHFARRNNLSELNAKESSQETAVGLFGLFVGSIVVRHVERREAVFSLMVTLVFVHLAMNYFGVRRVQLNVLNQQRATILFEHYLETGEVLTPAKVADRERIVYWSPVAKHGGEPVAKLAFANGIADTIQPKAVSVRHYDGEYPSFRLCICRSQNALPIIKVLLLGDPMRLEAGDTTIIRAWYSALALAHSDDFSTSKETSKGEVEDSEVIELIEQMGKAGWDVDGANLEGSAPWVMDGDAGKKEL
ncbi:RUS1 family protein-like protein [Colletotrichum sidae]|uniref:RUS1 family protein-like protein n=1 Tax=Colletotrichum sidae TaxID=1347389 RepID=A0A4R8TGP8_9PEZI|nr:RUS1 family protein-like protein [Colletotrichum sidae]